MDAQNLIKLLVTISVVNPIEPGVGKFQTETAWPVKISDLNSRN